MMDKENQGLNLDQDFVADLGVPFICSNCNELFGSQEYLNQHSDICHGFKPDYSSGADSDIYQPKNYDQCQQAESLSSVSSPFSYPSSLKQYNFHQNLMSSPALSEHESNHQRHYSSNHGASYSSIPLDALDSASSRSPNQSPEEFTRLSMQRNDVLLSSTTERAHTFSQLPLQFPSTPVDHKPTLNSGNSPHLSSPASQPVMCPGCHNTYINQWFLDQHSKHCLPIVNSQNRSEKVCSVVDIKNKASIPCPQCNLLYVNEYFLNQHLPTCSVEKQNPHPIGVSNLGSTQSFSLSHQVLGSTMQHTLNGEFSQEHNASALNIAMKTVTSPVTSTSQTTSTSDAIEKTNDLSALLYSCPLCARKFPQKSSLEDHIRTHTGEKPFECEECGQKFVNKSNLKKHYRTHTQEKPYQCTLCGDAFSLRTGLTRHWRTHTGEKPFECSECGQRFSNTGNLKKHMTIHTGDKGFGCKVCGRRFQSEESLSAHAVVHTGDKSYQCPMCDASFLHRGGLQSHFRTHTGEKPFSCDFCALTFARRGGLKAHLRTHTGEKPYVCSLCGQAFAHKSNLNAHNRTHTGEKPFGCSYCDQKFAHKSNLKKHLNTHMDRVVASSPAGSLSDSSCAVSDTSSSTPPMISAVTKMTKVMVSPFSDNNDSNFFDLLDMLEHPTTQALVQT